jgi:hypothetical protein
MSYLIAIIGLIAMGMVVAGAARANLSYMNGRVMMVNLLRTNPYQVERVAQSMKGTFFEPIAAALKTGGMLGTREPHMIAQATRPAYDAAMTAAASHWKMLFMKAKLAGMAGLGALAVPLMVNKAPPTLVILIAIAMTAGLVWVWIRKRDVEAGLVRARAEILPEAERALIDGRYVGAPPR